MIQPTSLDTKIEKKDDDDNDYRPSIMVAPGTYTATLYKNVDGKVSQLGEPQSFEVERIRQNVLENPMSDQIETFTEDLKKFSSELDVTTHNFSKAVKKVKAFDKALKYAQKDPGSIETEISGLKDTMFSLQRSLFGNSSKAEVGEKDVLTVQDRLGVAQQGFYGNTYGPTKMQMESFEMAKQQYQSVGAELRKFLDTDVPRVEKMLMDAGAPPIVD